jgi:hypothetical protein
MDTNSEKYIKVYKGYLLEPAPNIEEVFVNSEKSEKIGKVIVFDLDETIGSFTDLYILWEVIEKYIHIRSEKRVDFDELLELYPEFLRHGIINILEFLYHKKRTKECSNIFIYTNNQCKIPSDNLDDSWVSKIVRYLTAKVIPKQAGSPRNKTLLFDQIIHAFKINKKIVEVKRTTNEKTYTDLIHCTLLPKTTEICFIDNTYFPCMKNERLYYIQPKSYSHSLTPDDIIDRFMSSVILKKVIDEDSGNCFEMHLYDHFLIHRRVRPNYNLTETQLEIEIKTSQRLMYYIRNFFYLSTYKIKTRKIKLKIGRFTRKKNHNPNNL